MQAQAPDDWVASTASALCVANRWVSATSLLLTACAFAGAIAGWSGGVLIALILVIGAGEIYLAFRIEFDAGIFKAASTRPGSWGEFEAALHELGWRRNSDTERTSAARAAGLARLVRYSGALLVAQFALALVILGLSG